MKLHGLWICSFAGVTKVSIYHNARNKRCKTDCFCSSVKSVCVQTFMPMSPFRPIFHAKVHQSCHVLHTRYITRVDVAIRQSDWQRGKRIFQAVTPEPGQREKIMKRKVWRKTVKRRKERIAGTNMMRRQSSLRTVRPTANANGSVIA